METRWHTDFHTPTSGLSFAVNKSLYQEQSEFQQIEILDTPDFGIVMLLDKVLMLTSSDEFVYHEMLCHPALFSHPDPRKVLIIGGGDCGTLSRVLLHSEVQSVIQVEIDEMVTRVARQYFPDLTKACEDPKAELVFADGIAYVRKHPKEFDVILIDSTDPVGPAEGLFRAEFLSDCKAALKPGGIVCLQCESPWIPDLRKVIRSVHQILTSEFQNVYPYAAAVPTYQRGYWIFQLAGDALDPLAEDVIKRINAAKISCDYYNPGMHQASFILPEFVDRILRKSLQ